jgi:quercetin dioxygenase-like cupin family protein
MGFWFFCGASNMNHITARIHCSLSILSFLCACAATVSLAAAAPALADDQKPASDQKPKMPISMTQGWTVEQLAQSRGVLFAHELKDVPGKDLVVVRLEFPPHAPRKTQAAMRCSAHTHPGSVWVYVTKGTARLGLKGEPVHVVHTGESFYEHKGAIHTVGESASATEPASAIAVMIVPDGAPLVTPVGCGKLQ